MIYKDIAQYEESDSDLAKYTIMELQKEIEEWKKEYKFAKDFIDENGLWDKYMSYLYKCYRKGENNDNN